MENKPLNFKKKDLTHYIVEIPDYKLNSKKELTNQAKSLIKELGLKIVKSTSHNYKPFGITLVFILSSSHLIIHTWEEFDYLHLDLFCCNRIELNTIKNLVNNNFGKSKIRKVNYG